jgi:simple sugar transport system permease protein
MSDQDGTKNGAPGPANDGAANGANPGASNGDQNVGPQTPPAVDAASAAGSPPEGEAKVSVQDQTDGTASAAATPAQPDPDRWRLALKQILAGSWLVSLLSVVAALVIGAVLICATNQDVQHAAGYIFARPGDFFKAIWDTVSSAYVALFRGGVVNDRAWNLTGFVEPFTKTLTQAVPLIFAGLGLAIGFRAGLFNIGAQGQIILGAIFFTWIGFALHLPPVVHVVVAVVGALIGGAIWGFIPGFLKAKTGANEVIVTIMLNWIALYGVSYLLTLKAFQRPGSNSPQTPQIDSTATYPHIFGSHFSTNFGLVLAIAAAVFTWWLLERSTLGFRFRALGENPEAARTAGINISRAYIWVMVIAGALAGLAGTAQITAQQGALTAGVAGSVGFDAITVALLGRSKPLGTVLAGLLFGALKAGGGAMAIAAQTSTDIVLVLQSVIVLFIAAPPLVRAIFRTPDPEKVRRERVALLAAKEVRS